MLPQVVAAESLAEQEMMNDAQSTPADRRPLRCGIKNAPSTKGSHKDEGTGAAVPCGGGWPNGRKRAGLLLRLFPGRGRVGLAFVRLRFNAEECPGVPIKRQRVFDLAGRGFRLAV